MPAYKLRDFPFLGAFNLSKSLRLIKKIIKPVDCITIAMIQQFFFSSLVLQHNAAHCANVWLLVSIYYALALANGY